MSEPYDYDFSKAKHMHFKAEIEEANYHEVIGKVIPKGLVRSYHEDLGGKLKIGLQQLADRLSPRLVHESDETTIHKLISSEVRDVIIQIEQGFLNSEELDNHTKISGKKLIQGGKVSKWHK